MMWECPWERRSPSWRRQDKFLEGRRFLEAGAGEDRVGWSWKPFCLGSGNEALKQGWPGEGLHSKRHSCFQSDRSWQTHFHVQLPLPCVMNTFFYFTMFLKMLALENPLCLLDLSYHTWSRWNKTACGPTSTPHLTSPIQADVSWIKASLAIGIGCSESFTFIYIYIIYLLSLFYVMENSQT